MSRDSGFTLMETLVALVVLGFIVAGLAQGLRFGLAAWDRQALVIDRDGALDSTDRTLRRLLAGMMPGSDPQNPAIIGTNSRLAFTATLPQGAPAEPLRLSDIMLSVDGAHRLVMRWVPHLHARLVGSPAPRQAVLLPGVASLGFSYYGSAAAGQAAGWTDRWQDSQPPMLVRIHIGFVGNRLHWPDVIVAPMRRQDGDGG
jgi:general secretion pathway protein J